MRFRFFNVFILIGYRIHADISIEFWPSGAPLQVADAMHAAPAVDAASAKDAKDVKVVPLASSPAAAPTALGGWVTSSWNTNEVCYPSCAMRVVFCPSTRIGTLLTKPFLFWIGLVMFFNLMNLDTKLVVAILGQDFALCCWHFWISHPFVLWPTLIEPWG